MQYRSDRKRLLDSLAWPRRETWPYPLTPIQNPRRPPNLTPALDLITALHILTGRGHEGRDGGDEGEHAQQLHGVSLCESVMSCVKRGAAVS